MALLENPSPEKPTLHTLTYTRKNTLIMTRILLSGDREADIGIHHTEEERDGVPMETKFPDGVSELAKWFLCEPVRVTKVTLHYASFTIEARAVCKPPDNFCRATGRRLAANRLLKQLREHSGLAPLFTRDDRRTIFHAICPFPSNTKVAAVA